MLRRSFLIGATSAIITASFYRDVVRYAERKAAPLIIPPDDYDEILYAVAADNGTFDLYLGNHPLDDSPPDFTWRQFADEAWGWDEEDLVQHLVENYGLETEEEAVAILDKPANHNEVLEWYSRHDAANARAYHELEPLDLGPEFGTQRSRGDIRFIDGYRPGDDSLIVTARDMTSLSLLQARLTELKTGILVKPSTWSLEA
jgi:hypothetical protein